MSNWGWKFKTGMTGLVGNYADDQVAGTVVHLILSKQADLICWAPRQKRLYMKNRGDGRVWFLARKEDQ